MIFPQSVALQLAQTVKRLSTIWETWVRSLCREDPLEKEMATHFSILAKRIPLTWGCKELDTTSDFSNKNSNFKSLKSQIMVI